MPIGFDVGDSQKMLRIDIQSTRGRRKVRREKKADTLDFRIAHADVPSRPVFGAGAWIAFCLNRVKGIQPLLDSLELVGETPSCRASHQAAVFVEPEGSGRSGLDREPLGAVAIIPSRTAAGLLAFHASTPA